MLVVILFVILATAIWAGEIALIEWESENEEREDKDHGKRE